MSEWLLIGLNGGNPLAYLAALGTLRLSTAAFPERNARMRWVCAKGGWRPEIALDGDLDVDDWLSEMYTVASDPSGHAAFKIAADLRIGISEFRHFAMEAGRFARQEGRCYADFLAAFGSDGVAMVGNSKKTEVMASTAFRNVSGNQHFVKIMMDLAENTTKEHIRAALLENWTYSDPGPSMRWDPNDDRRHALRWEEPSGDPIKTVRGANRLAIEGLPLLPTAPVGGRLETTLETTGFRQGRGREVAWTWPIWTDPAGLDVLRSVLSLLELQADRPDRRRLAAIGITEIYRCLRITQGQYGNFTVAQPA